MEIPEITIEGCEDYVYRDFPNIPTNVWVWMIALFEEFGLKILTQSARKWPDGIVTMRGQLLIHPDGLAALKERFEADKSILFPDETSDNKNEMKNKVGCISVPLNDGTLPIKYAGDEPCHDCFCPSDSFHHPGCDAEICPKCDGQVISCECFADED